MVKRRTPAKRRQERLELDLYLRQVRDGDLPEPKAEEPACPVHGWGFADGLKPKPLASMCPHCRAEKMKSRETEREMRDVDHPLNVGDVGKLAALGARAEDRQADRFVRAGQAVPGSPAETAALDRINDLREAERERERKSVRWGRVVIERIEGVDVVQYVAPRGRRGLVRVVL